MSDSQGSSGQRRMQADVKWPQTRLTCTANAAGLGQAAGAAQGGCRGGKLSCATDKQVSAQACEGALHALG